LVQHNTSGIISRKGDGIDTPKGLVGKKYATWDLPIEKATIKQVMDDESADFSKVQLIPSTVTDEVSALKSKSVDAIWVFYGWAGVAAEVAKFPTDYFAFKDINPVFDYYTPVVLGNTDWMKDNPDATKKFLSCLKKGYEYSIDNPDAASDILLKAAPELDEKLVKESQKYLSHEYKSDAPKWGYFDAKRWNAFYNWINEHKLSDAVIPENYGFTNDYLA
jgi:ABC-type nitrate/sulfonate/bicarbonate transport system substrate-binding protein